MQLDSIGGLLLVAFGAAIACDSAEQSPGLEAFGPRGSGSGATNSSLLGPVPTGTGATGSGATGSGATGGFFYGPCGGRAGYPGSAATGGKGGTGATGGSEGGAAGETEAPPVDDNEGEGEGGAGGADDYGDGNGELIVCDAELEGVEPRAEVRESRTDGDGIFTDSCAPNGTLIEFYCADSGTVAELVSVCATGCVDGACVPADD